MHAWTFFNIMHKRIKQVLDLKSEIMAIPVSCRFGYITKEILNGKLHFLCSV